MTALPAEENFMVSITVRNRRFTRLDNLVSLNNMHQRFAVLLAVHEVDLSVLSQSSAWKKIVSLIRST
jgi:hypothetical protein